MFGRLPTNFGPPGPFPGPGSFSPFPMQAPQTGGFLARLLGGGTPGPGIGGIGGGPGPGILGLLNPTQGGGGGGFLGAIQNVEKFIKMAQTVKPMVDQYGPMVKNLPSMFNLIKEYQAYSATSSEQNEKDDKQKSDETDSNTSEESINDKVIAQLNDKESKAPNKNSSKKSPSNKEKKVRKKMEPKKSLPKLYI